MGGELFLVMLKWGVAAGVAAAVVYAGLSKAKWLRRSLIAGVIFVSCAIGPIVLFSTYAYLVTMNDPQPTPEQLRPAQTKENSR